MTTFNQIQVFWAQELLADSTVACNCASGTDFRMACTGSFPCALAYKKASAALVKMVR